MVRMGRVLLTAIMILSSLMSTALANPSSAPTVEYAAEEIVDFQQLLHRAQQGITDRPGDASMVKAKFSDAISGENLPVDVKVTTQRLKVTKSGKQTATSYKTVGIVTPLSSNFKTAAEPDPTWSVQFVITMYYTKWTEIIGAKQYIWVDVEEYVAYWQNMDYTVQISSGSIAADAHGFNQARELVNENIIIPISAPSYNFEYIVPITWGEVDVAPVDSIQHGRLNGTMKRGGSVWSYAIDVYEGNPVLQ